MPSQIPSSTQLSGLTQPHPAGTVLKHPSSNSIGLVFPILMMLSVLVVIIPVPPLILDLLLAANITGSVLVLLTTVFVARPLDFNVFPSLLLLATLGRLVLNVASTRLILTRAATHQTSAAGEVIEAFARFVAQGQLAVGLVLFAIIVTIQFVVVTKGATRLSEVAARFALDGMPGRQMAIDADLSAGHITADEARARRNEVTAQADFHAAMDGAGKFVRGDALAGILIILINMIGGLVIGILQYGMEPSKALEVFAMLTIGDGLVTQIPGFLIALAAALLATRTASESNLSRDVIGQTIKEPAALYLAAATAFALAMTGLPMLPLLILGAGCVAVGWNLQKYQRSVDQLRVRTEPSQDEKQQAKPIPRPEDRLLIEPIELELSFQLIRLANPDVGGDLMDRVTQLRHRIAQELGIILPKVKIRDRLQLPDHTYQIKLRGVTVASGTIRPERMLAIDVGMRHQHHATTTDTTERSIGETDLPGIEVSDPASQRPAKWIDAQHTQLARELGYKLVEPSSVLVAHMADVVKGHAGELLTRQHVHELLENLRQRSPRVVEELIPGMLKPAQVHQVLSLLLRERVPIRDLEAILETLTDHADRTTDPANLNEIVRQSLGRVICQPYRDASGTVHAITIDPALEDVLAGAFERTEQGTMFRLSPQIVEGVERELGRQMKKMIRAGHHPVVICGTRVRSVVRHITAGSLSKLTVLGLNEIPADTRIQSIGLVPLNAAKTPSSLFTQPIRSQTSQGSGVAMAVS